MRILLPLLLAMAGCADDGPNGKNKGPGTDTVTDTDVPITTDDPTIPVTATDPWTRDTGGPCVVDPQSCDTDCDGVAEEDVVIVRQPDSSILVFADLPAAASMAEPYASLFVCPGSYRQNLVINDHLAIFGADTGNRPRLVPEVAEGDDVTAITVDVGVEVVLVGLDVGGPHEVDNGGGSGSGGGGGGGGSGGGSGTDTTGVKGAPDSQVSIRHCRIHNHSRRGIYSLGDSLEVISSQIVDNGIADSGAAAHVEGVDNVLFQDVVMSRNYTDKPGGALYLVDCGAATLTDVHMEANESLDAGGAIYLDECDASIDGFTALDNVAWWGGGVAIQNATLEISGNSTILRNDSTIYGGAASVGNGGLLIADDANFGIGFNDNTPGDVYPVNLGNHLPYGNNATFCVDDLGVVPCP